MRLQCPLSPPGPLHFILAFVCWPGRGYSTRSGADCGYPQGRRLFSRCVPTTRAVPSTHRAGIGSDRGGRPTAQGSGVRISICGGTDGFYRASDEDPASESRSIAFVISQCPQVNLEKRG
jgi:hypothetical protein